MPGKNNNAPLVARAAAAVAALLLLLSTATTVAATTSTSTSASECSAESATCDEDPACLTCVSSVGDENAVSIDDCSARYPEVFIVGAEGSTAGLCESIGAAYCCAFEDSDTAYDCMNGDGGAAAEGYWGCLLAEVDCSIDDMPCYGALATGAPTATPSPVVAETLAPTAIAATDAPRATPSPAVPETLSPTAPEATGIPTGAPSPFVAVTMSPTAPDATGSPTGAPTPSVAVTMSPTALDDVFSAAPTASPSAGADERDRDPTPSPTVAINHVPFPTSVRKTFPDALASADAQMSSNGAEVARTPSSTFSSVVVGLAVGTTSGLLVTPVGMFL